METIVSSEPVQTAEVWAKVEIFGHRVEWGRVTEITFAGIGMVQVETPALAPLPETSRIGTRRDYEYDDRDRYLPVSKPGRYVRPASPAVPAQVFKFHPSAIFSIEECNREDVEAHHRHKIGLPVEEFIPDVPAIAAPEKEGVSIDALADAILEEERE